MSWNKIDNLLKRIEEFYKKALWSELFITSQHHSDINHAKKETPEQRAERETQEWLRKNDPGFRAELPEETKNEISLPEEREPVAPEPEPAVIDDKVGLYPEIISFAKQITNTDVSEKLIQIAELYKQAIENNKGFSPILNAISKFIENTLPDNYSDFDYEEDPEPGEDITPEQASKIEGQNIESLLNEVYGDINQRFARQRDEERGLKMPQTTAPISTEEDPEEPIGPKGYGTGLDKAEIGGKRSREDGTTGSMSATDIREPKDWVRAYTDEKNRYADQLSNETDPALKKNIEKQILILDQLAKITSEEVKMLNDGSISWTVYPKTNETPRRKLPDQPDKKALYDEIKRKQKELRSENNLNKSKIRNYNITNKNLELENIIQTTRSPKEKFLSEQKKLLNDLILSKDKNKTPEINARKALIDALSPPKTQPGTFNAGKGVVEDRPEVYLPRVSPEIINTLLKNIEDASKNKVPLTEYRKKMDNRAALRESQIFDGLVFKFGQQIDTIVSDNITKKVYNPLKAKLAKEGFNDPVFIPYLKAVTETELAFAADASPTNKRNLDNAKKAMLYAVNEWAENHPDVITINKKYAALKEVKLELKALTGLTGGRGGGKKTNEWLYAEAIPPEGKTILYQLNQNIKKVIADFKSIHATAMQQLTLISNAIDQTLL